MIPAQATLVYTESSQIRSKPCANCYGCGTIGQLLYEGLGDKLFQAPGVWSLKRCPNSECGLAWLDPMPLDEDIEKAYATYYTHQSEPEPSRSLVRQAYFAVKKNYLSSRYGYRCGWRPPFGTMVGALMYLHPGRRAIADFDVLYLSSNPNGNLLDVGSGSGRFLAFMKELGWQVQGVDFDMRAVRNAKAQGLDVRLGSLSDQKYPDESFDVLTMNHVIEHAPNPIALARECFRILKPHGKLVIVTPNVNSWGHRYFGANWRGLEPPRHLHIFARKPLEQVLRSAGFHGIQTSTTIRAANNYFIASRSLKRKGAHDMRERQTAGTQIWGQFFQAVEWAWLKWNGEIGEEIAAIAQK
jgi:2-polyprenyl-3-methyl-5-hydroxy-6-metoxy-1,4-benzoquinol methylase